MYKRQDYNLVMATPFGLPVGTSSIRKALNDLIKEHNLPPVVFHSLRHTSVTYKLKLNGGDIKAVQGDSGHSQINMVTDVYLSLIHISTFYRWVFGSSGKIVIEGPVEVRNAYKKMLQKSLDSMN